ncbi:MAG: NB-ARC domain-containing protein [Patescibacteria group bacterium]
MSQNTTFGSLFKKYRLLAGYDSVSSFAEELANRGYPFEDSIIYKWQSGQRVPKEREIILTIIKIFIDKKVVLSEENIQQLLFSLDQRPLKEDELNFIGVDNSSIPFQAPKETNIFIGREEIMASIDALDLASKVVVLSGLSGTGKTALAIKLAHLLKDSYVDGVLWCKAESWSESEIIFSLLKSLGEDISNIKSLQARAILFRDYLQKKKLLIIIDGVDATFDVEAFIPSVGQSTLLITTKDELRDKLADQIFFDVSCFNNREVLNYFETVLGNFYNPKHELSYRSIASKVGNLPLALSVIGANLLKTYRERKTSGFDYVEMLGELSEKYSNLYSAINNNFYSLK